MLFEVFRVKLCFMGPSRLYTFIQQNELNQSRLFTGGREARPVGAISGWLLGKQAKEPARGLRFPWVLFSLIRLPSPLEMTLVYFLPKLEKQGGENIPYTRSSDLEGLWSPSPVRLAFLVNVEVHPHPAAGGRASGTLTHLLTGATTWDAAEFYQRVFTRSLWGGPGALAPRR